MRPAFIAKRSIRSFSSPRIVYTKTDEAPALATYAFLPIIRRFTDPAGIKVELSDISVAARVLGQFSDRLKPEQQVPDTLGALGELAKTPVANIIKLPNISASVPQLVACIEELQSQGFDIPNFPMEPSTAEEKEVAARYAKVLGSAVNPVLREGNSDRRVAPPVKVFAQANPKRLGKWAAGCKTDVKHMTEGDFFSGEQSTVMESAGTVRIEFVGPDGQAKPLRGDLSLQAGEVIDSSCMKAAPLRDFLEKTLQDAVANDVMVSVHLKATMMKVSDPIIFGHVVSVYFKDAFAKHGDALAAAGANPNLGLGAVLEKAKTLPNADQVLADFEACYATRPRLAMVDSDRGITNLHVPSDVIIDASMPNVVRDSGGMWNKDGNLEDTWCVIPDRSYAGIYKAIVDDCLENGAFDPATMGNVANVGLMAQKAEEYGSHDKTFEVSSPGKIRVVRVDSGATLMEHSVDKGDIWRMCQTKDAPIRDWVKLAVTRARASNSPAVFWLNPDRAHDRSIMAKVDKYLPENDTSGVEVSIMSPVDAMRFSCKRARAGLNTISCTGNVLRDYLTDLFPILELGTSAKMLSIVPMLAGGAMYETGAGGSAPKHVQQFVKEGHLRWDSLGEYLALATSLEDMGTKGNAKAAELGTALSEAVGNLLDKNLSPSRKVNQIDNRGSHFHIAQAWAKAMARTDPSFQQLADQLSANEEQITRELIECQGKPMNVGGYYRPDDELASEAMRPSAIFNKIIDGQ